VVTLALVSVIPYPASVVGVPVMEEKAGVIVTAETPVISPFPLTLICALVVAPPKVPVLLLTVARVVTR
jgi:hypothetical protein